MTEPRLTFTQDYVLSKPRSRSILPVQDADWGRIKRLLGAVKPQRKIFQHLSAGAFGVSTSALFSVIGFYTAQGLPSWVVPTGWAVLVSSAILGFAFAWVDSSHHQYESLSAEGILAEMQAIEASFELAADPATPAAPHQVRLVEQAKFQVGDRVWTKPYGFGVVTGKSVVPETSEQLLTVRFDNVGDHRILPSRMPLKGVVAEDSPQAPKKIKP